LKQQKINEIYNLKSFVAMSKKKEPYHETRKSTDAYNKLIREFNESRGLKYKGKIPSEKEDDEKTKKTDKDEDES